MYVSCGCCVLSGRGICAGPIPPPDGSSACLSECDHMQQPSDAFTMSRYKEGRLRKKQISSIFQLRSQVRKYSHSPG